MATETEIAWCAGFFDGEGHVSYRRSYIYEPTNRVSGKLLASVPQNSDNIEVLEYFQSIVNLGTIRGPYRSAKDKTFHIISFRTTEIRELFILLQPYLRSKKTMDFQMALLQYETHDSSPTAEDYARLEARNKKRQSKQEPIHSPDCSFYYGEECNCM